LILDKRERCLLVHQDLLRLACRLLLAHTMATI
jgi:hypothetical protein